MKYEITVSKGHYRRCLRDIHAVLRQHNRFNHEGTKLISHATRTTRKKIIEMCHRYLHSQGYKLRYARSFKPKHLEVLFQHWVEEKQSPATIQLNLSVLRLFLGWVGKEQIMMEFDRALRERGDYDRYVKRTYVATESKAWESKGVIPWEKVKAIETHDEIVALHLSLQMMYGLRAQEAWLLKPHLADRDDYIDVLWGTKGGRPRTVQIRHLVQRRVLDYAKTRAKSTISSTIPAQYSLKQWCDHYYYVLRKYGIGRKEGIVAHGLRHQYAQELYELLTGENCPVCLQGPTRVSKEDDEWARRILAEDLGHSRTQITDAYIGR